MLKQGISKGKIKEGDIYIGQIINKKMVGKGLYHYSNGDIYIGDFENNTFNGFGVYCFSNGERYEGNFRNGLK